VTHANLVEILLGLYAGGLLIWFLLRTGFGDRVTFVLLMNYLGIWLFAPILVLIPWVILARTAAGLPLWSLRLTLVAAIPVLLLFRYYGSALAPARRGDRDPAADAPAGTFVTVLTFNLLHGNNNTDAVVAVLLASKADILALQEIEPEKHAELREALHEHYPYHAFNESGGLAVHSRFPILDEEILPFEPWPAQRLILQVGSGDGVPDSGVPLQLINAHLAPVRIFALIQRLDVGPIERDARVRKAQVSTLLETLTECGNGNVHDSPSITPTIVACDCNMTELNSTYAAMTGCLRDAYRERSWGLGHTFIIPRGLNIPSSLNIAAQRLDYLFHSDELVAERVKVIRNPTGSDHLPVLARFRLPDPASNGNGALDGTAEMSSRNASQGS
jgi:vancomycin resistance protein VanJ